ncbi:transferase hexapeptide repeat containing protein [Nostoc sp. UCD121]|uniref:transferase hexapeptide repeat containing protein n=2 Tax=Nostoc TaxID=1177 RepID=UPI002893053E|nr:transferase hexapeptide repeat containing protein [Nostoc sp. UCD121]
MIDKMLIRVVQARISITIKTKVSKKIMLDEANLEQRLATLEQTVADIKHRVIDAPTYSNWLEKVIGSISDEPAFLEALEYGRSLRHADIFTEETGEQL